VLLFPVGAVLETADEPPILSIPLLVVADYILIEKLVDSRQFLLPISTALDLSLEPPHSLSQFFPFLAQILFLPPEGLEILQWTGHGRGYIISLNLIGNAIRIPAVFSGNW
jgi:hypothetical protein